jgi:hypothetical protein
VSAGEAFRDPASDFHSLLEQRFVQGEVVPPHFLGQFLRCTRRWSSLFPDLADELDEFFVAQVFP